MRRYTKLSVSAVIGLLLWCRLLAISSTVHYAYTRVDEPASAEAVAAPARSGVPARIEIPSIAVDAAIEKVALAKDGSMAVPALPLDVAWYEPGPRPGETGMAAMTGHLDDVHGSAAVFADLHKVKPGDAILVRDETGASTSFVVRESRKLAAAADATEVFTSMDGKAHLSLITCSGSWDARGKQYSNRLVVFADKLSE